jgi:serine/threonine protein kinase/tetratricopeptide (TPR) repeat protein
MTGSSHSVQSSAPTELGNIEPDVEAPANAQQMKMGRYLVLRVIGQGGMGTVYEAYDPKLERKVAIKVLQAALSRRANPSQLHEQRLRLIREARSLASLSHPNIVAIFDVGLLENDAGVFLAMEFVVGLSLREHWQRHQQSWQQAVELLCQAGDGLAAAHARGIIHRDFKPENILVGDDGVIRVLDFGLSRRDDAVRSRGSVPNESKALPAPDSHADDARAAEVDETQAVGGESTPLPGADPSELDSITRYGTLMGTPRYMAPEQLRGEPSGASGDVFAFCTVLYEGIFGANPFPGETIAQRLEAMRRGSLAWPKKIPSWLRRTIESGLKYGPEERELGLAELVSRLRHGLRAEQAKAWMVPSLVVAAAIGAATTFGYVASVVPVSPCANSSRALDNLWTNEKKTDLSQTFREVGLNEGDVIWDLTHAAAENWRGEWQSRNHALCEQAEAAQTQRDARILADIEISRACLADNLAQFAALLDVWRKPSLNQVVNAPGAIKSLSAPSACMDSRAVRAKAPLPRDPELRAQVSEMRRILGAIRVYVQQAYFDRAETELDRIEPTVHQIQDLALYADYFETRASVPASLRVYNAGDRLLEVALAFGRAAGHWQLAARVATQMALSRFYMMSQQSGRDEGTRQAQTMVAAAGSPPDLKWQLATYEAVLLCMTGDQEKCGEKFVEALPLANEGFGRRSTETARTYFMLGVNASYRGMHEKAIEYFKGSLETNTDLYGATHPEAIAAHSFLAQENVFMGQLDTARWHAISGGRTCLGAGYSIDLCAEVFENAGLAASSKGNLREAEDIYLLAILARKIRGFRTFPGLPWPQSSLAEVMSARGDHEAAQALNEESFSLLRQEPSMDRDSWTVTQLIDGEIALAAGDLSRAQSAAQSAASSLVEASELRHRLLPRLAHLEGELLAANRQFERAVDRFERALVDEIANNGAPGTIANYYGSLAETLLEHGHLDAAEHTSQHALMIMMRQEGVLPHHFSPHRERLARVAIAQQRPEAAIAWLDAALADFDPSETLNDPRATWDSLRKQAIGMTLTCTPTPRTILDGESLALSAGNTSE